MERGIQIAVKDLPRSLADALRALGYRKVDVGVVAAETVNVTSCGWEGRRAYSCAVNLHTGQRNTTIGSFGGPNAYESRPVDQIHQPPVSIPPDGAIIKGYESSGPGHPCSATIYVRPESLAPILPAPEALTDEEFGILYCYGAIKSGDYRREELRRYRARTETIDGLVSRGYLERNRAGATKITTKGKNSRTTNQPRYPIVRCVNCGHQSPSTEYWRETPAGPVCGFHCADGLTYPVAAKPEEPRRFDESAHFRAGG